MTIIGIPYLIILLKLFYFIRESLRLIKQSGLYLNCSVASQKKCTPLF